MTAEMPPAYPIEYDVEPQLSDRNRVSVGFRIILAIPHLLIVGGPGIGGGLRGNGVLGTVAIVMAIISWFAIVFTGTHPRGLWDFCAMYMRWRAKASAYMALLRDEYPPFGEGDYPVTFAAGDFPATRNRWSVGLRIIYVIPHVILLLLLGIAWLITAVIGWFAILFTGAYPEGLYQFGIGFLRWSLRVEGYMLLMQDEYPPFSLQ